MNSAVRRACEIVQNLTAMKEPTRPTIAELIAERSRIDAVIEAERVRHDKESNALFGRNLKRLREAKGMTATELAESIGLTRSSITNMEAGRQATTWTTLLILADVLGVSLD